MIDSVGDSIVVAHSQNQASEPEKSGCCRWLYRTLCSCCTDSAVVQRQPPVEIINISDPLPQSADPLPQSEMPFSQQYITTTDVCQPKLAKQVVRAQVVHSTSVVSGDPGAQFHNGSPTSYYSSEDSITEFTGLKNEEDYELPEPKYYQDIATSYNSPEAAVAGIMNLKKEQVLSSGAFGDVYRFMDVKNNSHYAVKITKSKLSRNAKEALKTNELCGLSLPETEFYAKTRALIFEHENRYFALHDCHSSRNHEELTGWNLSCVVSDFIGPDTLFDAIVGIVEQKSNENHNAEKNGSDINWQLIQTGESFVKSIVPAVQFLHGMKIVHRDIKPENIMCGQSGMKLIDFGLSKNLVGGERPCTSCGSYYYSPPEQMQENTEHIQEYDGYKADVFSTGVTLVSTLTGLRHEKFAQLTQVDINDDEAVNSGTQDTSLEQHKLNFLGYYNSNLKLDGDLARLCIGFTRPIPKDRFTLERVQYFDCTTQTNYKDTIAPAGLL